jgi:osmoprotectant transport system ATP-binding protein
LVGESGSGKTTLLKTLCQLIKQKSGDIFLSGENIKNIHPIDYKKKFGYVIQKAGLLPHLNVVQNIELPARIHGNKGDLKPKILELFDSLNLDYEMLALRYPSQISGGQKQRVSIARALINDPELLFMDEPFGALDPLTKRSIYKDFLNLKILSDKTIIIVSHDMIEASILSDRIVLLKDGRFEQVGTYEDLKSNPKSSYVKTYLQDWEV